MIDSSQARISASERGELPPSDKIARITEVSEWQVPPEIWFRSDARSADADVERGEGRSADGDGGTEPGHEAATFGGAAERAA